MNRHPSSALCAAVFAAAAAATVATRAFASAPPSVDTGYLPGTVCAGGANKGASCTMHAECPRSRCVYPDFLSRPKLKGTLTIVVDDHVIDWSNDTLAPHKALTIVFEVKSGSQKAVLAETFESVGNAGQPPKVAMEISDTMRAFFSLAESNLVDPETACEQWLPRNRQPPIDIAEAMLALVGAGSGHRPVIVKAKAMGPAATLDHVTDSQASVVRCKIWIELAPLSLLDP